MSSLPIPFPWPLTVIYATGRYAVVPGGHSGSHSSHQPLRTLKTIIYQINGRFLNFALWLHNAVDLW